MFYSFFIFATFSYLESFVLMKFSAFVPQVVVFWFNHKSRKKYLAKVFYLESFCINSNVDDFGNFMGTV